MKKVTTMDLTPSAIPSGSSSVRSDPTPVQNDRELCDLEALLGKGLDLASNTGTSQPDPEPPARSLDDRGVPGLPARYRLVGLIGQGGMGRVFEAFDEILRRRVAVKVLSEPSRFLADLMRRERTVLAALQHPGIVSVYDSGELADGQPFYVMQFVEGTTLDVYVAQQQLGWRPILALVGQVARAVGVAHLLGIVHRDLKPQNIKVTAAGQPLVLDFGLAKVVSAADVPARGGDCGPREPSLAHTGRGAGTAAYMSPEQAAGQVVDARTDVYALGVVLYKLLANRLPVEPAALLVGAARSQPTPRPLRHAAPHLPHDVAAVVHQCLAAEPAGRYATATELADDLDRLLSHRPVTALAGRRYVYRAGKFVRRHWRMVSLVATAAAALALVVGIYTQLLRHQRDRAEANAFAARQEQVRANEKRDQAQQLNSWAHQVLHDLLSMYDDLDLIAEGLHPVVRKKMLQQVRTLLEQFVQFPSEEPQTRFEQARAYLLLAKIETRMANRREALPLYQRGVTILEQLVLGPTPKPPWQYWLARAYYTLAGLYRETGQLNLAKADSRKAITLMEGLVRDDPRDPKYQDVLGLAQIEFAQACFDGQQWGEAEAAYQQVRSRLESLVQANPNEILYRKELGLTYHLLGDLYEQSGRQSQSEPLVQKALEIRERLARDAPTRTRAQYNWAITLALRARQHQQGGRRTEAEAAATQARDILAALARNHPLATRHQEGLASSHSLLARIYHQTDRLSQAEKAYQQAAALSEPLLRTEPTRTVNHEFLITTLTSLGELYQATRRFEQAEEVFQKARDLQEQLTQDYPERLRYAVDLGRIYALLAAAVRDQGQWEASLDWSNQARQTLQAVRRRAPDHASAREYLAQTHAGRAELFTHWGRPAEAEAERQRALELAPEKARPTK
jgi:tetratricopeptide (TPR) repeat protein